MQTRMRCGIAAVLAVLTSAAGAAELPVPELYQARPAVVIFRWTGFYAGLHAGGGGGSKNEGPVPFSFANSLITPLPFNVGVSGWLAGGQVGANYQSESFVIGVEAQASGANIRGSSTCANTVTVFAIVVASGSGSCSAKVDALGSIGARLGYAFDHLLIYGKLGAAWSDDHYNIPVTTLVRPLNFSANETRWGWLLGVGAEYAFTDNWSAKIEYNYLGFGTSSLRFTEPTGIAQMDADIREQIHLVKVGINYRLGVNTIVVR
jgi:outer membrane immunogenic protein